MTLTLVKTGDELEIVRQDGPVRVRTGGPGLRGLAGATGAGDMLKSIYDSNDDGKVNAADAADEVPWDGVQDKPATFPPSAHTHVIANVTGLQDALDAKAPLASPALTGTPTAPTAKPVDNGQQIANTAFVQALVAELNPPSTWLPAGARAAVNYGLPGPLTYRATRAGSRDTAGTYQDANGVLRTAAIDALRINYGPGGTRRGALLEVARKNLTTNSGDMSSGFSFANANHAAAPDMAGGNGAQLVTASSTGNFARIIQSPGALAAGTYNFSALLKKGSTDFFHSTCGGTGGGGRMYGQFSNLATVVTNSAGGTLSKALIAPLGNGWFLASYTGTFPAASAATDYFWGPANSLSVAATVGDSITVWAMQAEVSDKPTSRILTGASTATRAADVETISPTDQTTALDWYARYDDGSEGKIASGVTGDFAVNPATLTRPNVALIWAQEAA